MMRSDEMLIHSRLFLLLAATVILMFPVSEAAKSGSIPKAWHQAGPVAFHRYWEQFPRPKLLEVVRKPSSPQEGDVLETLAGLVARAEHDRRTDRMIWIDSGHPAYKIWLARMMNQTHARAVNASTWQLVDEYKRLGIVKGYILFHYDDNPRGVHQDGKVDESLNVATSLCASMRAIAVSDTEEGLAQKAGLKRLFDARPISEQQCLDRYQARFSRHVVALIDPKVPDVREEAVAYGAFVVSRPGATYTQALHRLDPDSQVLGWSIGDEREVTMSATRQAAFMTDTDWCANLPALSTEPVGHAMPLKSMRRPNQPTIWDVPWEDNVHYVTFIMSDGDNIQWTMGDFLLAGEHSWWNSKGRGAIKLGLTTCYDGLAQVSPYTAQYLFQTAKPTDDFVLASGGYYYPDYFGADRNQPGLMALHAKRIAQYMQAGGIGSILFNCQDWQEAASTSAFEAFAQADPHLLGIFTINYDSYTAGGGAMRWVPANNGSEVPVVSLQFALWNHSSNTGLGDPKKIAEEINNSPHAGPSADVNHFSAAIIHAWSWFRPPGSSDEEVDQSRGGTGDTARGVMPALWCAEQLKPYVRVVTPTEFLLLMRLRIHPSQTLAPGLSALSNRCRSLRQGLPAAKRNRADKALDQAELDIRKGQRALVSGDYRSAWRDGKSANTLLSAIR